MVIRNLPLEVYRTQGDQFNNEKAYVPTAFVQLKSEGCRWIPVEIKCSKKFSMEMDYLDLKRNQVVRMAKLKGCFLFSGEGHYAIVEASFAIEKGQEVTSDKLDKPCFRILKEFISWVPYPEKLMFR